MGMYTEVFFRAEVDQYAYEIMRRIIQERDPAEHFTSEHPFFGKDRAWAVFNCASYYHPGPFHRLVEDEGALDARFVSFRNSLKNYDDEVEAFFDWVRPHVVVHRLRPEFIGYSLYEEDAEPILYFAAPSS